MAMTREYLELVESGIDIAPVGSQEEVQAAEYLLGAFQEHRLETELQDLSAPLYGRIVTGAALILMMLAAVFCGLGGFGWAIGGFLLALVLGAYLASDYLGMNPLGDVGPRAESQNVIGVHRGEGPMAGHGVRPVVVLARYDTGREELLCRSGLVSVGPLLKQMVPGCVVVVVVGALLQLFQFMAPPALLVLWIITIVAAVPPVVLGVNEISAPFLNLTDGANDNKASLGALLGVLEDVVPTDEERLRTRAAQLARAGAGTDGAEAARGSVAYEEYEVYEDVPVVGVRHGKQVLEAIGMLPPTCEIVYEKPERRRVVKRRAVEAKRPPEADTGTLREVPGGGDRPTGRSGDTGPRLVVVGGRSVDEAGPGPEGSDGDTEPINRPGEAPAVGSGPDAESPRARLRSVGDPSWGASEFEPGDQSGGRRSLLFDLPDPTSEAQDPLTSEGDGVVEDGDRLTEFTGVEEPPERPADESGGSGRGLRGLLRHRGRGDGDGTDQPRRHRLFGRKKKQEESLSEWLDVDEDFDARTEGEEIGTWDNFDSGEEDDWRGGATRSADARRRLERARRRAEEVEGEIEDHDLVERPAEELAESVPPSELASEVIDARMLVGGDVAVDAVADEEAAIASLDARPAIGPDDVVMPDVDVIRDVSADDDLVDAVLEMGDANLVAHDIWFVCVGASALGHAGTKAFVEAHRRELRGCFLINLDSVGAGELTALTTEGFGDTRKGDRKIQKLLDTASKILHVPVTIASHDWEDTDATPALRRSMRGLTLMGTVGGRQRALANTVDDVVENLNPNQVVYVSQLVSEIIRRT